MLVVQYMVRRMRTPSAIAERLAQTIGEMPPRLEYFIPTVTLELDAELEALFWFVITGICYQTHRLKGKIGNRELHGSDYMIGSALRTLQEAQNFWQLFLNKMRIHGTQ